MKNESLQNGRFKKYDTFFFHYVMNHYTIKLFYEISIRLCKEHIARHFFREKNYEINSFDYAVRLSLNGDLQNPVIYLRWSC